MDQPPRRDNRVNGIRALASMLPKVTGPIFKHRGFAEAGILTDWPAIVGPYLAGHTMPEKISFPRGARSAGTLHVVTESAFAPELQHVEPQLLERINGYFGYGAVARLKIQHGRVVCAKESHVVRAEDNRIARAENARGVRAEQHRVTRTDAAAPVADDPLHAALDRLGQAVQARQAATAARPDGAGRDSSEPAGKARR